ncbi:MAG: sulfotransferase, partial [Deltaproteobacteria bacterium]|nr:sulfotransferase [Deltaproteobacteria bacterium]
MADSFKYRKPFFTPKIWMGFSLEDWLKVLWESKFSIGLSRIHSFLFITLSTVVILLRSWIEYLVYHHRITNTRIELAPVFIIGHWRSGTTLLHELLTMDSQFAYANTYQCFNPNTFLLPAPILRKLVGWWLPEARPMDSMPMGISKPQEDEFALCILGAPSPYRGIMFPRLLKEYGRYLRVSNLPEDQQSRWKALYIYFLKKMTLRSGRRLVLKSPTHSFRVAMLSRMFPGARFIYIKRDPYAVYKSSRHMWMTLLKHQGLQTFDPGIVDEYVKDTYIALCDAVEKDRTEVPANKFFEISYEKLIAKPVETIENIYAVLDFQGFGSVRSKIEQFEKEN